MFAFKIGAKSMSLRALNIYKNRLVDAWIVEYLSATAAALSEI